MEFEAVELVEQGSERVSVTLPAELAGRLRAVAAARGIGLSTLVRMLLHASLERPPA